MLNDQAIGVLEPADESAEAADATDERRKSRPIVVLHVDDQPKMGLLLRDMLRPERDIEFHTCEDPRQAMARAVELGPAVILLDLSMPRVDGLELLGRLRSERATRDVPVIVLSGRDDPTIKARAFGLAASDYVVKLPHRVEMIARIRHHSSDYFARLKAEKSNVDREKSRRHITDEMSRAADYVRSLLPAPLKNERVEIQWRFAPSAQLGGDMFGYHWIDEENLAIYMLDVSGHGIGESIFAVSIQNTLSQQMLPWTDFHDPAAVMSALNTLFRMDGHGQRYFTIWYGIYDVRQRTLTFSGGGHPQPLLLGGATRAQAKLSALPSAGMAIGIADQTQFENETIKLPAWAQLILYSDGVVEIEQPRCGFADRYAFMSFISANGPAEDLLDRILERARKLSPGGVPGDDCSLVQVEFTEFEPNQEH